MVPETTRHSPIKRGHILTLITMSLFLWAACARESVPVTTAPRPPRQNRMYQVRGTETLSSIASRFAVKGGYHALIALNGLNAKGSIHEGQLLRIPHRVGRTDNLRPLPVIKQGLPKLLPCGKLLALPTKMLLPDGVSRHCVKVGADSFVCKEPGESADTYEIRFRKGTKSVLLLGGFLDSRFTNTFSLYKAKLHGGTGETLVVLNHERTSNGTPRDTFSHAIYAPQSATSPVTFTSSVPADFALAPLVRLTGEKHCSLLVSSRGTGAELEIPRGEGNYEVGRLYSYSPGVLIPRKDQPIRWYRLGPNPGATENWYRVGMTTADLFSQPWIRGRQQEYVLTNSRRTKTSRLTPGTKPKWGSHRLGHRPTGRLFPRGYHPSFPPSRGVPPLEQDTYRGVGQTTRTIVWILDHPPRK